jgi:subtilisin family serine protease
VVAGTSFAAPHVSGAFASLKSTHPTWTTDQIQEELLLHAKDLGVAGADNADGYGRLDPTNAVAWLPLTSILLPIIIR